MKPSLALLTIAATVVVEAGGGGDSARWRWADIRRRLSYDKIAGYGPSSQVTDHCAIDRDQAAIEEQLAIKSYESFAKAHQIYKEGGNSESYARITLLWPGGLTKELREGDYILGHNEEGVAVAGRAYEDYEKGVTVIKVRYETRNDQETYVGCQVGALVETNMKDCFAGEGELEINGQKYPYRYDPAKNNRNGRTIAGFSEGIEGRDIIHSKEDFKYFFDYYGTNDYAHCFVEAAFAGQSTHFIKENRDTAPFANGNADFSRLSFVGREQFIKRATECLSIFMNIIRQWEEALDGCERACIDCNKSSAHSWDEGVCYYTGSMEGQDGLAGDGKLMHQLADDMCGHYKTCNMEGRDQAGTAKLNYDLFGLFTLGNFQIVTGNCPGARATTQEIVGKMYVPLIQGAMMSAHEVDRLGGGEKEQAEGAAFAAAVLPRVHAASPEAARVIYENLKVGAPSTDAGAVKKAFESVYADIGISCEDVGGLWNAGMESCRDAVNKPNEDHSLAIILGSTFGALFVAAVAAAIYMHKSSPKKPEDDAAKAVDEHKETVRKMVEEAIPIVAKAKSAGEHEAKVAEMKASAAMAEKEHKAAVAELKEEHEAAVTKLKEEHEATVAKMAGTTLTE